MGIRVFRVGHPAKQGRAFEVRPTDRIQVYFMLIFK